MNSPKSREPVILIMGNPNVGKSTLFNSLTGLRQKISNFPGVTVERLAGPLQLTDYHATIVDIPGTYSLAATSPDEMIAVDSLTGTMEGNQDPDLVLVVLDACNLRRNMFLLAQILESERPVVVALNMIDRAEKEGIELDLVELEKEIEVPVIPISAAENKGVEKLLVAVEEALASPRYGRTTRNPDIENSLQRLAEKLGASDELVTFPQLTLRRAILDEGGYAETRVVERYGPDSKALLSGARQNIGQGRTLSALEARDKYSWINRILPRVEKRREKSRRPLLDFSDRLLNHPVFGVFFFVLVMVTVFQAVFSWSGPLIDLIENTVTLVGLKAGQHLGTGLLSSFICNGVVAGVGAVIVFLPQILILFLFIIILEDSGYMARAAFIMDRLMRNLGLSGQSFIPMLSSFACAVPGILGTRVVAGRQQRLATIMAAPFMTCSARLPVYTLLIAAFVPDVRYLGGTLNLQGLVLFGLYLLGIAGGGFTAWLIGKVFIASRKTNFLLEMPPYRMPKLISVGKKLFARAIAFLKRAGTIIFAVTLVIWGLITFPTKPVVGSETESLPPSIEESYLGTMSKIVSPAFEPLGWDWKVTASVIASFPAREVIIAVLGTIYAMDTETEEGTVSLTKAIQSAVHPDGKPVYTLPMVLGLLIFFAFCLQCVSTMAVMRKETGTWKWPIGSWVYMTGVGYLSAFLVFQIGSKL